MINFKKVTPADFNERAVLQMFREGILYYDPTNEISGEERINKIREYVARIAPLVSPKFRNAIDKLWNDIFQSEILMAFLSKKGNNRKFEGFHKYNLMRMICVMRNNGVYQDRSSRFFDKYLEPDVKDSNYRPYLTKGLDDIEKSELKRIIDKNKV